MVAVLAHALAVIENRYFGGQIDPGAVAVAALYHDAGEILTGDMPVSYTHLGSRCHLDELVSCHYSLCRRVLKINPYQIYQLRKIPVFQQAVEDLHINSTRHKPPHGPL